MNGRLVLLLGVLLFAVPTLQYFRLHGRIRDSLVEFEDVEGVNDRVYPMLQKMLPLKYFRYFKVHLRRDCPFWNEDLKCLNQGCTVEPEDDSMAHIWNNQDLGAIEESSFSKQSPFQSKCDYTDKDFCVVEDLANDGDDEEVYVDLLKNPERFTGYAGDSSRRVWQSIYEQNCFKFVFGNEGKLLQEETPEEQLNGLCLEKRAFFRTVSGMHASISIHLCKQWLNITTGEWVAKLDCFEDRVGHHPERLENLFFLYSIMLQSVAKLEPYLKRYPYCSGNDDEDKMTRKYLADISQFVKAQGPYIDAQQMFKDDPSLKQAFKQHFRNISRIMDCVGCEKCRLWGKIQTQGIGTALKVLFSYDDLAIGSPSFSLRRSEIVALMNAFGRYSESINSLKMFRDMKTEPQQVENELLTQVLDYFAWPVVKLRENVPPQVAAGLYTLKTLSETYLPHPFAAHADSLFGILVVAFLILITWVSA